MADKKNDPYLSLYPEDFVGTIWNDVCNVLHVSPASTEVRVYFKHDKDVIAELPEDDDEYEENFE